MCLCIQTLCEAGIIFLTLQTKLIKDISIATILVSFPTTTLQCLFGRLLTVYAGDWGSTPGQVIHVLSNGSDGHFVIIIEESPIQLSVTRPVHGHGQTQTM